MASKFSILMNAIVRNYGTLHMFKDDEFTFIKLENNNLVFNIRTEKKSLTNNIFRENFDADYISTTFEFVNVTKFSFNNELKIPTDKELHALMDAVIKRFTIEPTYYRFIVKTTMLWGDCEQFSFECDDINMETAYVSY
ncbi:MAG: hypothetical protein IJW25_02965 [Clostridia bacterium]|nr:hypothetical protein [Clostridia bacterium]